MLNAKFTYVIVDPCARLDSGVTSYTKISAQLLREQGITVKVIAKRQCESLNIFRCRLAKQVDELRKSFPRIIIEAPESDASTAKITEHAAELHIRLHCSRQLGAFVQGDPISKKDLALEQREISRAQFI